MAYGLDIVAPFDGDPDPTLPYASSIDRRFNPGSLALFEPTHSIKPLAAGVPASGSIVPNIVVDNAKLITGSANDNGLGATFNYNTPDVSKLAFERTGKGALHGISSPAARNGMLADIRFGDSLKSFLNSAAHRDDDYVLFIWMRLTRDNGGSNANINEFYAGNNASAAGNYLYRGRSTNALGLQRVALDLTGGWVGTPNATAALNGGGFFWGNSPPYASLNTAAGRSWAFYSAHLIHRPSAGMTFAQCDTADAEAFAQAFGSSGRFYNDTFNDPASVIPV